MLSAAPGTSEPMAIDPTPPPEPPKKQVNTSRCFACNKKIGLLGFKCKCEFVFCATHRAEDKHSCAFDYKAQGKELLTRLNPVIRRDFALPMTTCTLPASRFSGLLICSTTAAGRELRRYVLQRLAVITCVAVCDMREAM